MMLSEKPKRYFIIGDSLCQSYCSTKGEQAGWGEYLINHLQKQTSTVEKCEDYCLYRTDSVEVYNYAIAGRSTKSFIAEARFNKVLNLLKKDDCLLISFGHNDADSMKEERYTSISDYLSNIHFFVNKAISVGARPCLLTPIAPLENAKTTSLEASLVVENLVNYKEALEKFSNSSKLLLINLYDVSKTALGDFFIIDGVHLNKNGANFFAKIVADTIKGSEEC